MIGYATEGVVFPRNFAIDPTGTWLYVANQKADTIVQFRIDACDRRAQADGPGDALDHAGRHRVSAGRMNCLLT